jgi:hypothetical protein
MFQSWVNVTINDIKKGTSLNVKELDGIPLPDEKKYNGCVHVDDEG